MEVAHARSAALGHLVQGITGIPWYYRQFGYEYALALGGGRQTPLSSVPRLKDGEAEPYRLRPMTVADVPFVAPLCQQAEARSLVACPRNADYWRYLLTGPSAGAFEHKPYQIIETPPGEPAGYVAPQLEMWGSLFIINEMETCAGLARAVLPTVLRALKALGEAEARRQGRELTLLYFGFGSEHPAFSAAPDLFPISRPTYAWYMRVADLPAFLRQIAPALEARLAASPCAGYTGELLISQFTGGLRLVFEKGRLSAVEPWQPPQDGDDARANFPPLVFLQLLFGLRSLAELRAAFPDCAVKDETRPLVEALFPKQFSNVMAVGG
jgi:hypothetical protein